MVKATKMRILVLGGTGMLGHKMFQILQERFDDVQTAVHGSLERLKQVELFQQGNVLPGFDARELVEVKSLLAQHKPQVIVNCIGVIKQRSEAHAFIPSLTINSLF